MKFVSYEVKYTWMDPACMISQGREFPKLGATLENKATGLPKADPHTFQELLPPPLPAYLRRRHCPQVQPGDNISKNGLQSGWQAEQAG